MRSYRLFAIDAAIALVAMTTLAFGLHLDVTLPLAFAAAAVLLIASGLLAGA